MSNDGLANLGLTLQITSTIVGFVAVVLGLYVNGRMYRFKDDLIKQLNGTYVRSDLFSLWKDEVRDMKASIHKGETDIIALKVDLVKHEAGHQSKGIK